MIRRGKLGVLRVRRYEELEEQKKMKKTLKEPIFFLGNDDLFLFQINYWANYSKGTNFTILNYQIM